jgi:hypothetical protein
MISVDRLDQLHREGRIKIVMARSRVPVAGETNGAGRIPSIWREP